MTSSLKDRIELLKKFYNSFNKEEILKKQDQNILIRIYFLKKTSNFGMSYVEKTLNA